VNQPDARHRPRRCQPPRRRSRTLAAVGLALAQHAGDVTLPPAFASGVDAVTAAAVGDLNALDPAQARAVGSLAATRSRPLSGLTVGNRRLASPARTSPRPGSSDES
jgi:hypothetical protein